MDGHGYASEEAENGEFSPCMMHGSDNAQAVCARADGD